MNNRDLTYNENMRGYVKIENGVTHINRPKTAKSDDDLWKTTNKFWKKSIFSLVKI